MVRKLSAYNKFVKRFRKKGFSMSKIADLWRKSGKGKFKSKLPKTTKKTARKSVRRRKIMPKRKTTRRRKGNGMSSYSKSNIALGSLLGSTAGKFLPGASQFLPLVALLPKVPTALKVMGWTMASKTISDRYLNR